MVGPYWTVPKRPIPFLPGHFLMVKISLEMSLDGGRGKLIPWDSTLETKLGEVVNFFFLVQISNFFFLSFSLNGQNEARNQCLAICFDANNLQNQVMERLISS